MVLDQLKNADAYLHLEPRFKKAFDYLRQFTTDIPDGRYEVDGTDIYALVQSYESAPSEEKTFETHRLYADIQYIVAGREIIYYQPREVLEAKTAYDAQKDAVYYHDRDDRPLHVAAGDFVVFFPQDGHKPSCCWSTPSPVRKVVMKVRMSPQNTRATAAKKEPRMAVATAGR